MSYVRGAVAVLGLLGCLARPGAAAECEGVRMFDTASLGAHTLTLNGQGLRKATLFKVKVYVAGLYLAEPSGDAARILGSDQPWRLGLTFLRDVGASQIREAWEQGFENNAGRESDVLGERIATLGGWMEDMEKGATLTFSYRPSAGVEVMVGETTKGSLTGADFAAALLSIFLGPMPPNRELKAGLLGGGCT